MKLEVIGTTHEIYEDIRNRISAGFSKRYVGWDSDAEFIRW